jgi:hypothetical protein
MRIALFLIFTLTLHPSYGFADSTVECNGNGAGIGIMPTTTEFWVKQAQYFANLKAAEDLKSFCEWNRMDRVSRIDSEDTSGDYTSQDIYKSSLLAVDKDSAANALMEYNDRAGPWPRSMMGHPILKNSEYHGDNSWLKTHYEEERSKRFEFQKNIIEDFAKPIPRSAKFEIPKYDSMPANGYSPGSAERIGACSQFVDILLVTSCVSALSEVETYLKVHNSEGGIEITGVESLKKAQSKKYAEGLRHAVSLIYSRFKENSVAKEANVFDDIKKGFLLAGFTDDVAEDMAFESLAAISTGGPSFYLRTVHDDAYTSGNKSKNYSATALQAIALAVIDLDTQKMQSEKPSLYSIPNQVKFPCDSGKYYHFWLEAYLSRRLVKGGYDLKVARAASFIAQVGYQLRDTQTRKAQNQLITRRYGPTENGVRIDMNLAAMGVSFGVDRAQGRNRILDGEKGFTEILKAGGNKPSLSTEDAESWFSTNKVTAVMRFMDNMNPAFILDYYK